MRFHMITGRRHLQRRKRIVRVSFVLILRDLVKFVHFGITLCKILFQIIFFATLFHPQNEECFKKCKSPNRVSSQQNKHFSILLRQFGQYKSPSNTYPHYVKSTNILIYPQQYHSHEYRHVRRCFSKMDVTKRGYIRFLSQRTCR